MKSAALPALIGMVLSRSKTGASFKAEASGAFSQLAIGVDAQGNLIAVSFACPGSLARSFSRDFFPQDFFRRTFPGFQQITFLFAGVMMSEGSFVLYVMHLS